MAIRVEANGISQLVHVWGPLGGSPGAVRPATAAHRLVADSGARPAWVRR